jgi:hypothetical protein
MVVLSHHLCRMKSTTLARMSSLFFYLVRTLVNANKRTGVIGKLYAPFLFFESFDSRHHFEFADIPTLSS